jgi:hypothetical protein
MILKLIIFMIVQLIEYFMGCYCEGMMGCIIGRVALDKTSMNSNVANHFAYLIVNSLAFASAAFLFFFHSSAAALFKGSSGLGSASRLWIDSRTDFI